MGESSLRVVFVNVFSSLSFYNPFSTVHPLGPHASKDTHSDADFNQSPAFVSITLDIFCFCFFRFVFTVKSSRHAHKRVGRGDRGRREERGLVRFVYI